MKLRSNRHIPSSDVKRMLRFLHGMYEIRTVERFGDSIVSHLEEFMPNTKVCYEEKRNTDTGFLRQCDNYKLSGPTVLKLYELVRAFYGQKPIVRYLRSGGKQRVIRNSDIVRRSELERTDIYQHVLHPLEIPNQLYVLPVIPGLHMRFFLSRDRDFDDEAVEIFRLLTDHVALAYRNAQIYSGLQNIRLMAEEKLARMGLTPREAETLHWIHEGKRNSEVAIILKISERTVEKHVESILRKLKVETRTSAAIQAGAFLRSSNS